MKLRNAQYEGLFITIMKLDFEFLKFRQHNGHYQIFCYFQRNNSRFHRDLPSSNSG
jgi:hypothetical protein